MKYIDCRRSVSPLRSSRVNASGEENQSKATPLKLDGNTAHEEVIVGVDRHLVLVMSKMLDGVCHSRVPVEVLHSELLWEMVREDLLGE